MNFDAKKYSVSKYNFSVSQNLTIPLVLTNFISVAKFFLSFLVDNFQFTDHKLENLNLSAF